MFGFYLSTFALSTLKMKNDLNTLNLYYFSSLNTTYDNPCVKFPCISVWLSVLLKLFDEKKKKTARMFRKFGRVVFRNKATFFVHAISGRFPFGFMADGPRGRSELGNHEVYTLLLVTVLCKDKF